MWGGILRNKHGIEIDGRRNTKTKIHDKKHMRVK